MYLRLAPMPLPPRPSARAGSPGLVVRADNLDVLARVPGESVDLIYIDPPFNTGAPQTRTELRTVRDDERRPHRLPRAALPHAAGRLAVLRRRVRRLPRLPRAAPRRGAPRAQADRELLLAPRLPRGALLQGARSTRSSGATASSTRSSGRTTTARARRRAGRRSTTTSSSTRRTRDATSSTPTRSIASRTWRPGSSAPEKAARGKLPTDTWWHTIVSPTGKEKLGYPTQKPLGILRRIVQRIVAAGRRRPRLLRRQRHDGRGGAGARAARSSWSTRARRRSR